MKKNFVLFALSVGLIISNVSAEAMESVALSSNYTKVISISAGPIWTRAGETQTFYLTPEIEKTYKSKNPQIQVLLERFLWDCKNHCPAKYKVS